VQRNGNFAVEVTQLGCPDTSACEQIFGLGLKELSGGKPVVLFPNPGGDVVSLVLAHPSAREYVLMNDLGQVVEKGELNNQVTSINTRAYARGLYFLTVPTLGYSVRLILD
jgi:hypothetical protein